MPALQALPEAEASVKFASWAAYSKLASTCVAAASDSMAAELFRQCTDQAAASLQTSLQHVPLELGHCQRVSALRWRVAWRFIPAVELPLDERMLSAVDCVLSE